MFQANSKPVIYILFLFCLATIFRILLNHYKCREPYNYLKQILELGLTKMEEFKVAIAQMDIKLGDKESNLKKASEVVSEAAKQGADFVCLPEYFSTGGAFEQFSELKEPIPGDTADKLGAIAEENGVHLVASMLEGVEDKLYNAAVLLGPNGELLAKQRKIHLFLEEQTCVSNGADFTIADTKFGKVGLMVCYDTIFPEVSRELALQGADIIFVPANWPDPFSSQWQLATSARALDNQAWLVAANRVGTDGKFTYFGKSRVVSPYGESVVEAGNGEEIITTMIDPKVTEGFKNIVDFMKDRQPGAYP